MEPAGGNASPAESPTLPASIVVNVAGIVTEWKPTSTIHQGTCRICQAEIKGEDGRVYERISEVHHRILDGVSREKATEVLRTKTFQQRRHHILTHATAQAPVYRREIVVNDEPRRVIPLFSKVEAELTSDEVTILHSELGEISAHIADLETALMTARNVQEHILVILRRAPATVAPRQPYRSDEKATCMSCGKPTFWRDGSKVARCYPVCKRTVATPVKNRLANDQIKKDTWALLMDEED